MKLNHEIFHKFFRAGETECGRAECGRAKSNTSFYGNAFKSYNTTIGIKTPGKDGRPVLLIADSSFSRTTGEHISALRAACPYPSSHIIRVPFTWGDVWYKREYCIDDLLHRFIDRLSHWEVDRLKYAESRRNFLRVYWDFSSFLELVAPKRPAKAVLQKIEELAVIANKTEDRKKRNELISGLMAKREAAAEKRKHAEFLKQFSIEGDEA